MIKWKKTKEELPLPGREIVAKNPDKEVSRSSAAKQCRVMKFNTTFCSQLISDLMIGENFLFWAYVDGGEE